MTISPMPVQGVAVAPLPRVLDPQVLSRCASLLKPLYGWVVPEASWDDVEAAVCWSSNEATDRIVDEVGLETVLERIEAATGVRWLPAKTWGRVLVSALEVEAAYSALVRSADLGDLRASDVLGLMRAVVPWQRFGTAPGIAMKAGWDLDDSGARTHLVLIGDDGQVAVALTACDVSAGWRAEWKYTEATDRQALARLHHELLRVPFDSSTAS